MTTPHRGVEPRALKEVRIEHWKMYRTYLRRAYIGFLMKTGDVTVTPMRKPIVGEKFEFHNL